MPSQLRFPAEWEPQSAVLLAWPHEGTDWAERLADVERTYVALVAAISRYQPVLLCVASPDLGERASGLLALAGVDPARLRLFQVEYDDTWLRDSGPITLREADGFRLLDFHFTAWGGKFGADRDDQLVARLHGSGLLTPSRHQRIDFALEGGGIETDGAGTLLSTWRCLHERHPTLGREAVTAVLQESLAQTRTLWLDHGYLEGDDTDAHIDTLARFAAQDAIVYQGCDDASDPHFGELQAMARQIASLRTATGQPYRLFPLPWAQPIREGDRRLAASYANFLIINGAVLMPAYGDVADGEAAAVLARAFPGRQVIPVDCRALIWQNGSLHCVTMQLPEGLLA